MTINKKVIAFPEKIMGDYDFYQRTATTGLQLGEDLAFYLMVYALRQLNVFHRQEEVYTMTELREKIELRSEHYLLFDEIISILVKRAYLEKRNDTIASTEKICDIDFLALIDQVVETKGRSITKEDDIWEFMDEVYSFIFICGINLPDLLQGEKKYHQIMFPMKDFSMLEAIYKGNEQVIYNNLITSYLEERITEHSREFPEKPYKILEVGAGTGGSSIILLEKIKEKNLNVEYSFTDISRGLLRYAQRNLHEIYPFLVYRKLDISKEVEAQGFELHAYDAIICQNVLHATAVLEDCIIQINRLLQDKGILILKELIRKVDFATTVFGLTPDWWNASDGIRIPGSPLLTEQVWMELLAKHNLEGSILVSEPTVPIEVPCQSIIIGEK